MIERFCLWLAVALYTIAATLTLRQFRHGLATGRLRRISASLILGGFALHTAAMWLRGTHLGRCPVTNQFEVQVFLAWAAVFFYWLIGASYRLSLLGAFTAPLVVAVLLVALLAPIDRAARMSQSHSASVEFHAAVGMMAWGAAALAGVIGLMFLIQERLLKSRHPGRFFLLLPATTQLDVIGFRVLVVGLVLLTVGMIGGVVSQRAGQPWPWPKTAWAVLIWCLYAALVAARGWNLWQGRKAAVGAIAAFLFTWVAYWAATWLAR